MAKIKFCLAAFVLCFVQCVHSSFKNITPQYLDSLLNNNQYKEFTDILHIPNKDLVDPSQRKSNSDEQFYYNGMPYGDILFRPGQLLNPDQINNFNGLLNIEFKTWKNGTVPYYISNTFNGNQKNHIFNVITHNNQLLGPNVVFQPYKDGDVDYVFMFNGGCGFMTNFGNVGGPQVISLPQPFSSGQISHELQHTLGFGHEHNRIDRDEYLKLIPENINEVLKPQYIKYTSDNLVNLEPYNYYSIMSYPIKVPIFNLSAFEVLEEGVDTTVVGIEFVLRPSDIRRVKKAYPLS